MPPDEFARRGAKVVVSARRTAEIESLAAALNSEGLEATAARADVSREVDIADLIAATIATYGRIDIALQQRRD